MSERDMEKGDYVSWLEEKSMLADASRISGQFSGVADVWQSPFATPDPSAAMEKSSVWFTAYPISMIPKPGHSFLSTPADQELWDAYEAIGIKAVHTGPLKRAGGIFGRELHTLQPPAATVLQRNVGAPATVTPVSAAQGR